MMGRFALHSATLRGVEAHIVQVEVSIGPGIPGMSIVGMPDTAVQESRERVKSALRACGFQSPPEKVVVNLAPGSMRKSGSGFDLPIALGILVASGQLPAEVLRDCIVVGELSLDGSLRDVPGMLAFELCARKHGFDLLCPASSCNILDIEGVEVRGAATLTDFKTGEFELPCGVGPAVLEGGMDYREVGGHDLAKRALQIAAAGNHGLLMMGPPGSGKTMLAERLPTILPRLSEEERLETAQVYSAAGEDMSSVVAGVRPFRHPHHSVSNAGLLGGGSPVRPGEVSLAHNGVMFLDEIAEFPRAVLQGLRQPMEDGTIIIVRAEGAFSLPARFMLVAASNPCPCGYYGDAEHSCTCSVSEIAAYQNRLGGPLLDRIDLQIDVWRTPFEKVVHAGGGISSDLLREGVLRAREFRSWREARSGNAARGGQTAAREADDLLERNRVGAEAEAFLRDTAKSHLMSGRGIVRSVNIARTVADLSESETVETGHMAEALGFRLREVLR